MLFRWCIPKAGLTGFRPYSNASKNKSSGAARRAASAVVIAVLLLSALSFMVLPAPLAAASGAEGPGSAPHIIPIHGPIEPGLVQFVQRAIDEARAAGAPLLIFEVNTPGGRVDAAFQLRDLVLDAPVPTAVYVSRRALSAGALIAMAGEKLYMAPGSTIGAAEPVPYDEKTVSAVRAEFESTAEARGRDPRTAAAMVDSDVVITELVEEGKILTLTAKQAVDGGFADGLAATREELLELLGFGGTEEMVAGMKAAEWVARWVTHPTVSALLLALGFLGLLVEVFTPGFGVPGTVGITSIALYFGGHVLAGLAGIEAALLVVAAVALLAIEAVIPGFGFFGIAGLAAMVASVFLVSPTPGQAARNLAFALLISVGGAFVFFRLTGGKVLPRLTLAAALTTDGGYIARSQPMELEGSKGVAVTDLRPSGAALIDGRRWDVVTEGVFIPKDTPVEVIQVKGNRIVVQRSSEYS